MKRNEARMMELSDTKLSAPYNKKMVQKQGIEGYTYYPHESK